MGSRACGGPGGILNDRVIGRAPREVRGPSADTAQGSTEEYADLASEKLGSVSHGLSRRTDVRLRSGPGRAGRYIRARSVSRRIARRRIRCTPVLRDVPARRHRCVLRRCGAIPDRRQFTGLDTGSNPSLAGSDSFVGGGWQLENAQKIALLKCLAARFGSAGRERAGGCDIAPL